MKPRAILSVAAFLSTLPAAASPSAFDLRLQDSPSQPSQESPKKAGGRQSQAAESSAEERKKTKKVWTNDNLDEVSGSVVSQIGNDKNRPSGKSSAAGSANSQLIASFRQQLATLQVQMTNLEKEIADLKGFSKGEASNANGLQLHKRYTTEPIDDQLRKLGEKKKLLTERIEAVFDSARKLGIEPGQLR
jgi:hypothetical protein